MSDKPFCIGKALRETVERGILTGTERETHYQLERETESTLNEFKWLAGGNARDIRLNVPIELFTRQITTPAFPIGVETFGVSNLLTWSACFRAGATVLSGLSRNANLWSSAHCQPRNGCLKSAWSRRPTRFSLATRFHQNGLAACVRARQ